MKCQYIIDCDGPNPEFDPPDPSVDPAGFHAYDVPHTIIVPAGMIDEHPLVWVHCFPMDNGEFGANGRPVRAKQLGRVLAVPVDDECRAAFEKHLRGWAAGRGWTVEKARTEINKQIAAAKAQQARLKAAQTATNAPPALE